VISGSSSLILWVAQGSQRTRCVRPGCPYAGIPLVEA
jgi:hypothetical protein